MERQSISVRGMVQGVGFRPFVYGLASRFELSGYVQNLTGAVLIEVEGRPETLDRFFEALQVDAPCQSRIEAIQRHTVPVRGESGFRIESSEAQSSGQVWVSPDLATCDSCVAELFNPSDRRFRYAFLNCTDCGPRLTIIEGTPYDRHRTTMAEFTMCPACRAEYIDPNNRRFHAQATACADCGPRLEALTPKGEAIATVDPLGAFVEVVKRGGIGAMKGIGGFHLVCDATNEQAVRTLRVRKHRDQKPFAVMMTDVTTARRWCDIDHLAQRLLDSPQRPIVLVRMRSQESERCIADSVAPGNPYLGVMFPYTPVHHLLMDAVSGLPLVMTSGNRSDEPIARTTDDAVQYLRGIADLLLAHNRSIHVRCDDSVTRVVDGQEALLRRSRGYAPLPIQLPFACPRPSLAVGGQLKGVFALGSDHQAYLSHHLGDLDHFAAYRAFEEEIKLYESLFDIEPEVIVHDLHPNYISTAYAIHRAVEGKVQRLATQHHHAHMASCMAEHELDEPVIGVVFDGTGYGPDGAVWGGEFLVGDYLQYSRFSHLRNVRLPGGNKAIEEPWRMAVAQLHDAGHRPVHSRATGRPNGRYEGPGKNRREDDCQWAELAADLQCRTIVRRRGGDHRGGSSDQL